MTAIIESQYFPQMDLFVLGLLADPITCKSNRWIATIPGGIDLISRSSCPDLLHNPWWAYHGDSAVDPIVALNVNQYQPWILLLTGGTNYGGERLIPTLLMSQKGARRT